MTEQHRKEKAIDLIQKVLAKAGNNSSEHEVEVATMKAQALMVKYNLTMEDIETLEEKNERKQVVEGYVTTNSAEWYLGQLSMVIGKNFRCTAFSTKNNDGKRCLKFVGMKDDVEIARKVYTFIRGRLEMYAYMYTQRLYNEMKDVPMEDRPLQYRKNITANSFTGAKNDYIKGFINGLAKQFEEQVKNNDWGLILVQDKAVTDYVKSELNLKKGKSSRVTSSGDKNHYSEGFKKGKEHETEQRKEII